MTMTTPVARNLNLCCHLTTGIEFPLFKQVKSQDHFSASILQHCQINIMKLRKCCVEDTLH